MAWSIAVVVESQSGVEQALHSLASWLPERARFLSEKQHLYDSIAMDGPHLHSPDEGLNRAFDLARANMQMLEAESPALGQYFYAGLEMFPFWFGNDGAYGLLGLLINNQHEAARNHLLIGTRFHQDGGIPHQISPAGDIVGGGNAQETSQWVSAVWDYYRWTGDRDFLSSAYPTAVAGIFDYTMEEIDQDDDNYPEGPAMVEREGMGLEKVDATSYLWLALNDLTLMAEELNDFETAERARLESSNLQDSFTADWWLPEEKLYANSLPKSSNTPPNDGHWTVAVPLEVGIAPPEQARQSLERIQSDHLNEWGLVHTLGDDERVWTLPTAVLSHGAYNYGDAELGFAMLQNIAKTLDHGSIGLFHELIPDGLSFFQLWSGATFMRGIIEDLMGIDVRSDRHEMIITPQLPGSWESAGLEQLRFGGHTVSVMATHSDITVTHDIGQVPLSITYRDQGGKEINFHLEPGETHNMRIGE
jgi:glycogen debranching enzyme